MGQVESAQAATDIAVEFVKRHYLIAQPKSAKRDDGAWAVTVDVGAVAVKIATVRISAETGVIEEYDIPS